MDNKLKLDTEKLKKLQKEYDCEVEKSHSVSICDKVNDESMKLAIFDEIGELTHELKGNWCWWKNTQKPVDRKKALGELVDVLHFVLSEDNNAVDDCEKGLATRESALIQDLIYITMFCSYNIERRLMAIQRIAELLGFTPEELETAYEEKRQENFERIERGY